MSPRGPRCVRLRMRCPPAAWPCTRPPSLRTIERTSPRSVGSRAITFFEGTLSVLHLRRSPILALEKRHGILGWMGSDLGVPCIRQKPRFFWTIHEHEGVVRKLRLGLRELRCLVKREAFSRSASASLVFIVTWDKNRPHKKAGRERVSGAAALARLTIPLLRRRMASCCADQP